MRPIRRRRRIAVVTGTRAEYGLLRSTLAALSAIPTVDARIYACGMHLVASRGKTVREIEQDGWPIAARVAMQRGDDCALDQAAGLARGVDGLARAFARDAVEIVLVLGDRIEAMAGALAAVTTHRVLAHVHGGDIAPGDFDDGLRHAITKLAHIHFVASANSGKRVRQMGEERSRIIQVGAPGLDDLFEIMRGEPKRVQRQPEALVLYHAHGGPAEQAENTTRLILERVARAGLRRVVLLPNTDRGNSGVLRAVRLHERLAKPGEVDVIASLPREAYLRRLLSATLLIGNSSSGILEAPLARTPSINVGQRQLGREPAGPGIFHVPTPTAAALDRAIRAALRAKLGGGRVKSPYGAGGAGQRIARTLATIALDDRLMRKTWSAQAGRFALSGRRRG